MDSIQKQRNLIEQLVRANSKFSGNEDLFEDFCAETYKRSYSLFDSLESEHLKSYIAKVVNTSILTVLKDSGRIRRRENRYVSTKEIPISPVLETSPQFEEKQVSTAKPAQSAYEPDGFSSPLLIYDIEDPCDSFEEKIVRKDLLQKVVDIVLISQKNSPQKEYLKIFYLRFMKNYKQKEIADIVNISQGEVSKRLLEIADIVKAHFNS